MTRLISICALAAAACGGGGGGPGTGGGTPALTYTDPAAGGALRLVQNAATTTKAVMLDFVVGDAAVTGYTTGFDLPLDASKVKLGAFTPGTVLDPGSAPAAAGAAMPGDGAAGGMLVVGVSQKATGAGAIATDTALPPGTVLFTVELDTVEPFQAGVVFDGTASGFALPSGGLRTRTGTAVVDPGQVKIGKLELRSN